MAPLTADRSTPERLGLDFSYPLAAAIKVFAGSMVALNAAGFGTPGAVATTLHGVAVARETVDNTAGAAGDKSVTVKRGTFRFGNSAAGDAITRADIGNNAFIVDDQTVAKTNGSATRSVAGVIRDVDAVGVWVEF